jgi:hypothetical protein
VEWDRKCKEKEKYQVPEMDNTIEAKEFEECLSGVARIIYFRKNSNDSNWRLQDFIEGQLN